MNAVETKKGLGRGLASLLGDTEQDYATLDKLRQSKNIGIAQIIPNPNQPRKFFDADELKSLSESIKARGVLQPLLVRRISGQPNQYELVAGERRWRAAQMAGIHEVPVVIKELSDLEVLEISIIENVQRQDLNAMEEAQSYDRLIREFQYSQDEVGKQIGKSRSYISNIMRLLQLPQDVQTMVREGKITAAHARSLLSVSNPSVVAKQIVTNDLSVRQVEALSREEKAPKENGAKIISLEDKASFNPQNQNKPAVKDRNKDGPDANTRDLEKQLSQILGMRVEIKFFGKAGNLTVHYQGLEQLDDLLRRLGKK